MTRLCWRDRELMRVAPPTSTKMKSEALIAERTTSNVGGR